MPICTISSYPQIGVLGLRFFLGDMSEVVLLALQAWVCTLSLGPVLWWLLELPTVYIVSLEYLMSYNPLLKWCCFKFPWLCMFCFTTWNNLYLPQPHILQESNAFLKSLLTEFLWPSFALVLPHPACPALSSVVVCSRWNGSCFLIYLLDSGSKASYCFSCEVIT